MPIQRLILLGLLATLAALSCRGWAVTCPSAEKTSLQWGEPPAPWQANPFSPMHPQGDSQTQFIKASILVAGLGRGVSCTYQTSVGQFSIWWPTRVRTPSPLEVDWVKDYGGYACQQSLSECRFTVIG